jgi:hypothetical protein
MMAGIAAHAGGLFGPRELDPRWCEIASPRQTVVYLDDMLMVEGKTDWALKLGTKLKATLAAGERVTVVRLSPHQGQSQEVWTGCWPSLAKGGNETQDDSGLLRRFEGWFTRDPKSVMEEQQGLFTGDFGEALTKVYVASKRPAEQVRIDPNRPPDKNLVRALASDEARFALSHLTTRAVIYSDMAENSDLGSVFKHPPDPPENYGKRLGTYLRRSVFYIFGVGEDIANAPGIYDATRKFWTEALGSMSAAIGGIGADLNVPNTVPVAGYAFTVSLLRDGQDFDGKLSLLVDSDGSLVDSWLSVSRLALASLAGTFRCDGQSDDKSCRLEATTSNGIVTLGNTESLTLVGGLRAGFKGELGVKGAMSSLNAKIAPE